MIELTWDIINYLYRLIKRHFWIVENVWVFIQMGILGETLGGVLGGMIGKHAGRRFGGYTGVGEQGGQDLGTKLGQHFGRMTRYKKGGRVKRTGKAIVHKGEYVLPKGVKPTKTQMKKVAAKKKRKGKKMGRKRK